MIAIMFSPGFEAAVSEGSFCPFTFDIIQPDVAFTSSKLSSSGSPQGYSAVKFLAHDLGTVQIPAIIAHCPPLLVVEHLNSPNTATCTIHQSDLMGVWNNQRNGYFFHFPVLQRPLPLFPFVAMLSVILRLLKCVTDHCESNAGAVHGSGHLDDCEQEVLSFTTVSLAWQVGFWKSETLLSPKG